MGTDDFVFSSYHAGHKHAVETISLNGTPYNYTYDANGNMTSGPDFTDTSQVGTRTMSYNVDNMPTQVTSVRGVTSTTVNYGYDGFGQRYKKEVVGGMTTYYIGDHFEIKGGTQVKYIFAGNLRVAQVEGSTLTYLHKDHLGSSTVMTDYSGFETESTQYMPFGSTRPGSGEITGTSYNFTDQEFDTENGLYNYDARLYDPVIGRFISPDTIVPQPLNPQSLNRYTYCLNNPLIYTDPSGHKLSDHWLKTSGTIFVLSDGPGYTIRSYERPSGIPGLLPDQVHSIKFHDNHSSNMAFMNFYIFGNNYGSSVINQGYSGGYGGDGASGAGTEDAGNEGVDENQPPETVEEAPETVEEAPEIVEEAHETEDEAPETLDMIDAYEILHGRKQHPYYSSEKWRKDLREFELQTASKLINNPAAEALDSVPPIQPVSGNPLIDFYISIYQIGRAGFNKIFNGDKEE
jgi:RHS repeat-associated protein